MDGRKWFLLLFCMSSVQLLNGGEPEGEMMPDTGDDSSLKYAMPGDRLSTIAEDPEEQELAEELVREKQQAKQRPAINGSTYGKKGARVSFSPVLINMAPAHAVDDEDEADQFEEGRQSVNEDDFEDIDLSTPIARGVEEDISAILGRDAQAMVPQAAADALGLRVADLENAPEFNATADDLQRLASTRVTARTLGAGIRNAVDMVGADTPTGQVISELEQDLGRQNVSRFRRIWHNKINTLQRLRSYLTVRNLKMACIATGRKTYFVIKSAAKIVTVISASVIIPATLIVDSYRGFFSAALIGVLPEMLVAHTRGYLPKENDFMDNFWETYEGRFHGWIEDLLGGTSYYRGSLSVGYRDYLRNVCKPFWKKVTSSKA